MVTAFASRRIFRWISLVLYGSFIWHAQSFAQAESIEAPAAKIWQLDGDAASFEGATISVDGGLEQHFPHAVAALREAAGPAGNGPVISVEVIGDDSRGMPDHIRAGLERPEAYWIEIDATSARIVGADEHGALYGIATFERLLRDGSGDIRAGRILDWPDHHRRAIHITLRGVSARQIRDVIDEARRARMNTLMLQLSDAVKFDARAVTARDDALTKRQLRSVVSYARKNGLEVIPEIKLLSHQEKFFHDDYPALMYNKVTYDPRVEQVYVLAFEYLDELLATLKPAIVHIGHDEVKGFTPRERQRWLDADDETLPAELFIADVERLHRYFSERGIEVWMWGDMLIAPEEFPGMHAGVIHGSDSYSKIRNRLPRDIVICDWHYKDEQRDFPSARVFAEAGYPVLGVTFEQPETIINFSRYVWNMSPAGEGMIATTWFELRRNNWDIVRRIIEQSGQAFWSAD